MIFDIIDDDKAEQQLAEYFANSVHYTLIFDTEGNPVFILHQWRFKTSKNWTSEDTTSMVAVLKAHAFIEVTIENQIFNLPLCLLQEESIRSIKLLLSKTVDPKDGRYGSKQTGFIVPILIIDAKRMSAIANVDLRPLSFEYVTTQCFPKSALEHQKSPLCPFCNKKV